METKDFIKSWQTYVAGLIIAASVAGLGFAADARWLRVVSFEAYVEQSYRADLLAEIRDLEITINELMAEISWTDDPRKKAALEERVRYLETLIHEIERELEVY